MNMEQARFNMIEQQIRPWDVLDARVLSLLSLVRREEFVPASHRKLAFTDTEIPLPGGQCMLAPKVEARLLQEMRLQGSERVLEVGAGSGFMSALMAHQALEVLSLEIRPELAQMAQAQLRKAGLRNVTVTQADGGQPGALQGLFDVIMLSGSVSLEPAFLLSQLRPGGRLLGIFGQEPVMRAMRITRTGDQAFERSVLFDTVAQRLDGFPEPSRFQF